MICEHSEQPRAPHAGKIRVCVFSHSYLDLENRKNIDVWSRYDDVTVVMPHKGLNPLAHSIWYDGHGDQGRMRSFHSFWLGTGQYVLASVRLGLSKAKPQVVVAEYNPWSSIVLQIILALRLSGSEAKLICIVKKNTYREHRGLTRIIKAMIARAATGRVDVIFAVSQRAANVYFDRLGIGEKPIHICPQLGIDVRRFCPRGGERKAQAIRVGFCGRFDEDKGVIELIESMKLVQSRLSSSITLELTGAGSLLPQVLKLEEAFSWLSYRGVVAHEEMPEALQRLDLFVMASKATLDHEEHDAHALLEAMSVGLPCIATNVGIIPEILNENVGVLVAEGKPEELARAICELLSQPERMELLGSRAREWVCGHWSLEAVAELKSKLARLAFQSSS